MNLISQTSFVFGEPHFIITDDIDAHVEIIAGRAHIYEVRGGSCLSDMLARIEELIHEDVSSENRLIDYAFGMARENPIVFLIRDCDFLFKKDYISILRLVQAWEACALGEPGFVPMYIIFEIRKEVSVV